MSIVTPVKPFAGVDDTVDHWTGRFLKPILFIIVALAL